MRHEPRFLLAQQSDLRESGIYFSILRAIAAGHTHRNEIADRVGRSDSATGQLLDCLMEMGLVRRIHPVTVADPDRTRTVRFTIDDPFLRFWFTFVHPYESRLHRRADAHEHLREQVMPELDAFVSRPAFEQVCQQWLRECVGAAEVGWWWGNVKQSGADGPRSVRREIDAVAVDHEGGVLALGSCKWTAGAMGHDEQRMLESLSTIVAEADTRPAIYLVSRSGFDAELTARAGSRERCHLVHPRELL